MLGAVYDRLERLDTDLALGSPSPSVLLEPFERPDRIVQLAVTDTTTHEYFLSEGFDDTRAGIEARTIIGRLMGHQLRLRSIDKEWAFQIVNCGCPIQTVGFEAIDPMSLVMLGQMKLSDLTDHFSGYRMGMRRARRIKAMADRIVADLID